LRIAITRQVASSINQCELTFLERAPIDVERARRQHAEYESALRRLGVAILGLPEMPDLPDSVFVEDAALVLDECAVITRPGAPSRRPETQTIEAALRPYRKLLHIEAPARMDGGDILTIGHNIYVGLSERSDANAMEQLQDLVAPFGYEVHAVPVTGCLHLKSAATRVATDAVLANPAWVDPQSFGGVKIVEIEASEPHAANALLIEDTIIYAASFPRTQARLAVLGIPVLNVEADELAKAEGAVTCCSLVFEA
jgi:dimethylargininase